ncbi:MAG: hypothetical protein M1812_006570 [Candelaria pacifica]|nr:MAG: hypothetical protein M1812_006570 [Candelaria pacifica]
MHSAGDGSIAKTLGEVTAEVSLGGKSYLEEFHILPGLPCDVLLGEGILDETDAFSAFEYDFVNVDVDIHGEELFILRKVMRKPWNTWKKVRKRECQQTPSAEDAQLNSDRDERRRHDLEVYRIGGLPAAERQAELEREQKEEENYNLSRYKELVNCLQESDRRERDRRAAAKRRISAFITQHRPPAIADEELKRRDYDRSRQQKVDLLLRSSPHPLYPPIPAWP